MKGYNFWHDLKKFPNFYVIDLTLNPLSRTFQQLTHNITGQEIIYNLDGSKAYDANSRSESVVRERILDFAQTGITLGGPLVAEVNVAAKGGDYNIPSPA